MGVGDVVGREGVGGEVSWLIRVWKSVEKLKTVHLPEWLAYGTGIRFQEGVLKGVTVGRKLSVEAYAATNSHHYSISYARGNRADLRDLEAPGQFDSEIGGG
jgi:hypothetical protein